jgi:hypothetical protein
MSYISDSIAEEKERCRKYNQELLYKKWFRECPLTKPKPPDYSITSKCMMGILQKIYQSSVNNDDMNTSVTTNG